jgi:hypothetical protein
MRRQKLNQVDQIASGCKNFNCKRFDHFYLLQNIIQEHMGTKVTGGG